MAVGTWASDRGESMARLRKESERVECCQDSKGEASVIGKNQEEQTDRRGSN